MRYMSLVLMLFCVSPAIKSQAVQGKPLGKFHRLLTLISANEPCGSPRTGGQKFWGCGQGDYIKVIKPKKRDACRLFGYCHASYDIRLSEYTCYGQNPAAVTSILAPGIGYDTQLHWSGDPSLKCIPAHNSPEAVKSDYEFWCHGCDDPKIWNGFDWRDWVPRNALTKDEKKVRLQEVGSIESWL